MYDFHIDGAPLWTAWTEQLDIPPRWNIFLFLRQYQTLYSIIIKRNTKTLPHSPPLPKVQVIALHRVNTGLSRTPLLLQSRLHRELVDGGVGLRGCMIWRWYAVAGFATVVTVTVIHGTIMVFEG